MMIMVETSVFAHHVQQHVESIMKCGAIGLCQKRITFMNPKPSCPDYVVEAKCDQFKMVIPYAGVPVECLVMFQANQPSCPPDFIFADTRFIVPFERMTILHKWNVHYTAGLLDTIKELMYYYKKKHLSLLEKHFNVYQEYLSLVTFGSFSEDDVEVYVPSNNHIAISLLIRLKADLRCVPAAYFTHGEARRFPILLVTFHPHDKNKHGQKLYFSCELEAALGVALNFKLPNFHPSLPLGQYITIIQDELAKKAEMIATAYELRKRYVAMFVSRLENCIVEYDVLLFRRLSFMIEEEDYHILVEITIPHIYPVTMPMITFRSLYHAYQGIPTSVIMNSYPFSPDWTFEHIYEETMKYVNDYASLFPQDSVPYQ